MSAPQYRARVTFAVPAGAGSYAPERITFAPSSADVPASGLLGATVLIESAPAAAVVELFLLKVGGDPTVDADYILFKTALTSETVALASYPGAQIRVKSGGTAGNCVVSASAD